MTGRWETHPAVFRRVPLRLDGWHRLSEEEMLVMMIFRRDLTDCDDAEGRHFVSYRTLVQLGWRPILANSRFLQIGCLLSI